MMNRKMSLQVWLIALCAGFMGSVVAERWTLVQPVIAQGPSQSVKLIEAQELRITDKDGKVRIMLSTKPNGSAALMVVGKSSKSWVGIGLEDDDRPYVGFGDINAQTTASLGIEKDGSPLLEMKDRARKGHVVLGLGNNGYPSLYLSGGDERESAALHPQDGLILWGSGGKSQTTIASPKKGVIIGYSDSEGQRFGIFGNITDGKPVLALRDASGIVWKAP